MKLTKKFRMKVKDIQETLSNFNEKMKEKNGEIGVLQSAKEAQAQDLEKLKVEAESREQRIVELKERESDLMADLEAERSMRIEYPEENEAAVEKNVIANESGFFLIESNDDDDDDEGKKSESVAKKTNSRPIEDENEKYEEDPFEEEFDVEENSSGEVKKEKVEDVEEPRSETNCGQKRKKNLESENNEKRLCVIPEKLPLKDRTLNKNMKMNPSFKNRMMRQHREDLRSITSFKDSTLKPFPLIHFTPQNFGSFSFSWPIVPYVPNRILEQFHKQIYNL